MLRTTAVRWGRGKEDNKEKVCLRDEMTWTKYRDTLGRPGEIGEKEGSKVNPTLQLRLQGLFKKNYLISPFPPVVVCPLVLIPESQGS